MAPIAQYQHKYQHVITPRLQVLGFQALFALDVLMLLQ
jgi:hypothetical protein